MDDKLGVTSSTNIKNVKVHTESISMYIQQSIKQKTWAAEEISTKAKLSLVYLSTCQSFNLLFICKSLSPFLSLVLFISSKSWSSFTVIHCTLTVYIIHSLSLSLSLSLSFQVPASLTFKKLSTENTVGVREYFGVR